MILSRGEIDELRGHANALLEAVRAAGGRDSACAADNLESYERQIRDAITARAACPACPFCGGPFVKTGTDGRLSCVDCNSIALRGGDVARVIR